MLKFDLCVKLGRMASGAKIVVNATKKVLKIFHGQPEEIWINWKNKL